MPSRSLRPHCRTGKTLTCAKCGNTFYVQKCRLKRAGGRAPKYCSIRCRTLGQMDRARHGHATRRNKKRTSKTYAAWLGMKARVKSEGRHKRWYKDKGITACPEWMESFEAFLADMGECPKGLTLERIDGTKGYYKENCRWASQKEQNRNNSANRMLTLDGKTQCVGAWAEETGLKEATIRGRLNRGWSDMFALHVPLPLGPRLWEHDGRWLTLRQWASESGHSVSILKQRIRRGWSMSQAVTAPRHTKFCTVAYREAVR